MLCAGELKLKVSGREVTTAGQLAIDALKTNNTFRNVSVGLRQGRPAKEALARAAQRLSVLVGETIIPLEQDISQAAARHFPRFQQDYAPLAARLDALGLAGAERVRSLNQAVADLLFNDASDATAQLGAEASSLDEDLTWAQGLKTALDQGLEKTLSALNEHRRELKQLPDTGVPGALRSELAADMKQLDERLAQADFHRHGPEYAATLTHVKARVRDAALQQATQHQQRIKDGVADLQRMPGWAEMTAEQRSFMVARLEDMALTPSEDLAGLRSLLARQFDLASVVDQLKRSLQQEAEQRVRQRFEEARRAGSAAAGSAAGSAAGKPALRRRHTLPAIVRSADELDAVITGLQTVKQQASAHAEVEIAFDLAATPVAP